MGFGTKLVLDENGPSAKPWQGLRLEFLICNASFFPERSPASARGVRQTLPRISARPRTGAGIYGLAVGAVDRQSLHDQNEIYYVISGRAHFRVANEVRPIQPGDTPYVAAQVPHKFRTITEDLTLLVFFAPAEGEKG